ncbi:HAD family hydrolase [Pseudomonas citronellolis]|uniref:HAD family hydrolase n=1 Tax=Pseudomonas citronellolis TaxID=53408 RepID=UPI0009EB24CF|nr:HAD-IA family hydrolase [Pseudomonas citronellolis]
MRYKNYFLDCDGVILDSNNFKLEAMRHALSHYPKDTIDKFIEYFKNNFGKSRYQHIDVFFSDFLRRPIDSEEKNKILSNYANICRESYLKSNTCDGLQEFLETTNKSSHWVVSGSDQLELREVLKELNLSHHFIGIYGSPTNKAENIRNILKAHRLQQLDTCMIGDALGDFEAAQNNKIDFIFCQKYSNTPELADILKDSANGIIYTLAELE